MLKISDNIKDIIEKNTRFALKSYSFLKHPVSNIVFSPYSIFLILSIAYAASKGKTEQDISKIMGFDKNQKNFHKTLSQLNKLITGDISENIKMSLANSLWLDKSRSLLGSYVDLTLENYGKVYYLEDFINEPDKAANHINEWATNNTNGKIRNIIDNSQLSAETILLLMNAIYFKGDWADPFEEYMTSDQTFYLSDDTEVKTPMMYQKLDLAYMETEKFKMLRKTFEGYKYSVVFMLPRTGHSLDDITADLTAEKFNSYLSELFVTEVELTLPRYKILKDSDLKAMLSDMGLGDIFSEGCDFSGFDGTKDIFISDLMQKAFFEINEKGCEAAALTGMLAEACCPEETKVFKADHPFLFFLTHNETGTILFMGRLNNPTKP